MEANQIPNLGAEDVRKMIEGARGLFALVRSQSNNPEFSEAHRNALNQNCSDHKLDEAEAKLNEALAKLNKATNGNNG